VYARTLKAATKASTGSSIDDYLIVFVAAKSYFKTIALGLRRVASAPATRHVKIHLTAP